MLVNRAQWYTGSDTGNTFRLAPQSCPDGQDYLPMVSEPVATVAQVMDDRLRLVMLCRKVRR